MLTLFMRPSNTVCDLLHMTDEHERGMMRMLVNMMLLGAIGAGGLMAGWLYLTQ